MSNRWDNFNKAWDTYIGNDVIGMKYISEILKHSFLGTVIPTKLKISDDWLRPRIHVFFIQPPTTGKSRIMKRVGKLINYIDEDSCIQVLTVTDAKLTGTFSQPVGPKDAIEYDGWLTTKKCIIWDEASILLKQHSHNESLSEILQMAIDDPGKNVRGVVHGEINKPTETTILAITYPVSQLADIIVNKGLLQRFFIVYHVGGQEEFEKIDEAFPSLFTTKQDKTEDLMNAIKQSIKDLPHKLEVNVDDLIKFQKEVLTPYRNECIYGQYLDGKAPLLRTFWMRLKNKMMKIALQYAVMNEKKEIDYESYKYAFDLEKKELSSIQTIIESVNSTPLKKQNKDYIIKYLTEERSQVLIEIMMKKNKIGRNKTLSILNEMETDKLIEYKLVKKNKIWNLKI